MDRRSDEARRANAQKRIERFEKAAEGLLDYNRRAVIIRERKTAYQLGLEGMCAMFDEFEQRRQQLQAQSGLFVVLEDYQFFEEDRMKQVELSNGKSLKATYDATVHAFALLESPMMSEKELQDKIDAEGPIALDTAKAWVQETVGYYQNEFHIMAYAGEEQALRQAEGVRRLRGVGDYVMKDTPLWAIKSWGVPRNDPAFVAEDEKKRWEDDVATLRNKHLKKTVAREWELKISMVAFEDLQSPENLTLPVAQYTRLKKRQPKVTMGTPGQARAGRADELERIQESDAREAAKRDVARRLIEEREREWQASVAAWERASTKRLELAKSVKRLPRAGRFLIPGQLEQFVSKRIGDPDEYAWTPVAQQKRAGMFQRHVGESSSLEFYESDEACARRLEAKRSQFAAYAHGVAQRAAAAGPPVREQDGAFHPPLGPVADPIEEAMRRGLQNTPAEERREDLTEAEEEWLALHAAEQRKKTASNSEEKWVLLGSSNGRLETPSEALTRLRTKNNATPAAVSDLEREWIRAAEVRGVNDVDMADESDELDASIPTEMQTLAEAVSPEMEVDDEQDAEQAAANALLEDDEDYPRYADSDAEEDELLPAPGTVSLAEHEAAATGRAPRAPLPGACAVAARTKPPGRKGGVPLCVTLERLDVAIERLDAASEAARVALDAAARREAQLDELLREIFGALLDQPPADEQAALDALNKALQTPPPPPSAALVRAMGGGDAWRLPYASYLMGFVELSNDGERVERFVALPLSPLQWVRAAGLGDGVVPDGADDDGASSLLEADQLAALRRAPRAAPERLAPDVLAAEYRPRTGGGSGEPMTHVAAAAAQLLAQAAAEPPWRAALLFG